MTSHVKRLSSFAPTETPSGGLRVNSAQGGYRGRRSHAAPAAMPARRELEATHQEAGAERAQWCTGWDPRTPFVGGGHNQRPYVAGRNTEPKKANTLKRRWGWRTYPVCPVQQKRCENGVEGCSWRGATNGAIDRALTAKGEGWIESFACSPSDRRRPSPRRRHRHAFSGARRLNASLPASSSGSPGHHAREVGDLLPWRRTGRLPRARTVSVD